MKRKCDRQGRQSVDPLAPRPERDATAAGATQRPRGGNDMDGQGNKAISLKLCRNVVLRDFSILRGGHFAILATGVDNLTIDNLKVDTNRDGFDIDCCFNVRISNCSVNSPNDDANRDADAKAFATFMRHIRASDSAERTTMMVQLENEVGLLGDSRDRSPLANEAFTKPVPKEQIDYLQTHPQI